MCAFFFARKSGAKGGDDPFCRYIHDPVLFHRPNVGKVKFDVRYILLLRSVRPLDVLVYNNFWLRFANKPFDLGELDVYEKHFTVMNYKDDAHLEQVLAEIQQIPQDIQDDWS